MTLLMDWFYLLSWCFLFCGLMHTCRWILELYNMTYSYLCLLFNCPSFPRNIYYFRISYNWGKHQKKRTLLFIMIHHLNLSRILFFIFFLQKHYKSSRIICQMEEKFLPMEHRNFTIFLGEELEVISFKLFQKFCRWLLTILTYDQGKTHINFIKSHEDYLCFSFWCKMK